MTNPPPPLDPPDQFDGTLETPWEDLERSALRLEGKAQQGGYRNQLVLEGAGRVYQGTLFWKYQSDDEWDVNVEVGGDLFRLFCLSNLFNSFIFGCSHSFNLFRLF